MLCTFQINFFCTFYIVFICVYIHSIYIPYTLKVKMKVKKWRPEKLKMVKKTFFPRNVWGPLGCHLLSSLVPKSRFRGSGKIIFFKKSFEVKKDAELPPEYFPCGGSA